MNDAIVQQTMRDIMALGWTKGQVEAIANTVAKGATLHELYTFLYINKSYGLDPFKRESHFMKDHKTGRWSIIIGIDGMRKIARRDPSYLGVQAFAVREGDEFAVDAANYTVVHKFGKQRGKVLGAWARADAKGRMPVIVWVDFEEYYRPGWDAWVRMPATMIAKVAESHALRRQFGLGDLYTEEEMGVQVSEVADADEVTVAVPVQEAPDVPVFTDEPEPVTETEVPQAQPAAAEPLAQSAPQKKAEYEEKASLSAVTMLRDVFKRKCPGQDIADFLKERAGVEDPRDLTRAQCKELIGELQKLPDAKKANEAPKQERPAPAAEQKQAAALQPGSEALFKMLTAGEVREFPDGRKYYVVQVSAVQPAVPGAFELYCPVDKVSMLDKAQPNMHIAVAISKVNGSRLLASTAVITEAA